MYVRPGETILVAYSDKAAIKLDAPASSQTVKLTTDASGTAAKVWTVTFTAPKDGNPGETDVTYTIDGVQHHIIVQVSAIPQPDSSTLGSAATILGQMLVVAIIMESAFAVIFNWRVFLEFFDGRGVRTVVMFIGGWIVAYVARTSSVRSSTSIFERAASPLRTRSGSRSH